MSENDKSAPNGESTNEQGTSATTESGFPLSEDLVEVQRQRDEYLDLLQRSRAEFNNYQKRAKAQADVDRQYAVSALAKDLLDVLDNCERGADAAKGSGASSIVEGFDMVHRLLLSALAKQGVEPIEALGKPFDPNMHEALAQRPSADHPEGTVVAELGKGYVIKDRVLRPSRVAVSVAQAE